MRHFKQNLNNIFFLQVEYSFPPLVPGAPNECPAGWKYLPTLALPDGSHNYEDDTVFFHLPSLTNSKETVFGISCFRQIPVEVCFLKVYSQLLVCTQHVFVEIKEPHIRYYANYGSKISLCVE